MALWVFENSIIGNNITNNDYGIRLDYSSKNNCIIGNNIAYNDYGVWLNYSSKNSISGNTFTNDGLVVWQSYQNYVEDNIVNGKPLVYLEDVADYGISDAGQVILVNCNAIRVENLNLSRTSIGVQLWNTTNSIIMGNNITANTWEGILLSASSINNSIIGNNITNNNPGVWLCGSPNNSIIRNSITANTWEGILLSASSINNSIIGNNITNNWGGIQLSGSSNNSIIGNNITASGWGHGILLGGSSNNVIIGNNITNGDEGIRLDSSENNCIIGNNIAYNGIYGIELFYSSNNSVIGNNITNNGDGVWLIYPSINNSIIGNNITNNDYGVCLDTKNSVIGNNITNNGYGVWLNYSSNNSFYYNNFVDNTEQVYIGIDSSNTWDNGYPVGGNYWSGYIGVDKFNGPNQNLPGSDGIGDTPYRLDSDNVDHYPLMCPYERGVSVENPSIRKLAFRVSIEPTGKSEPDKWNFRIVLWDIIKRLPDIISDIVDHPATDVIVAFWDVIVADENGDGRLDADEVLDALAENIMDEFVKKIIEQAQFAYSWPLYREAVEHAGEIFTIGLASVIGTVGAIKSAAIGFFTSQYSFGIPVLGYQELSGLWKKFPFVGFSGFQQYQVSALSPVDLTISDSFGRVVNRTICEIPGAEYKEFDANRDGDLDIIITLPNMNMKYNLTVTPKMDATPSDDYLVIVENDYISFQIVNSTVAEIPNGGYNVALYTYDASTYEALEIGFPIRDPRETVEPYQNVTVTVSAFSPKSEIVNVILYFSLDNGTTWTQIKMTEIATNIYQAVIPGQQNDTWVSYYIVAYDNAGNLAIRYNDGYYYQYYVIPEFQPTMMWLLLLPTTLISIILMKKRKKSNSHRLSPIPSNHARQATISDLNSG